MRALVDRRVGQGGLVPHLSGRGAVGLAGFGVGEQADLLQQVASLIDGAALHVDEGDRGGRRGCLLVQVAPVEDAAADQRGDEQQRDGHDPARTPATLVVGVVAVGARRARADDLRGLHERRRGGDRHRLGAHDLGARTDRGGADHLGGGGRRVHGGQLGAGRRREGNGLLAFTEAAQVGAQLVGRGIAIGRALGEQLHGDRLVAARHVGPQLGERLGRVVHLAVGDGHGVATAERRLARHHLVHHDAERVEVAARVGVGALRLLGREVGGGAHHCAGLREVGLGG